MLKKDNFMLALKASAVSRKALNTRKRLESRLSQWSDKYPTRTSRKQTGRLSLMPAEMSMQGAGILEYRNYGILGHKIGKGLFFQLTFGFLAIDAHPFIQCSTIPLFQCYESTRLRVLKNLATKNTKITFK
jgi:hypothetical protein